MPATVQMIGKASIVTWSMDGFLQVLWRKGTTGDIADDLAVLLSMAVVITGFTLWRFKRGDLF